MKQTLRGDQADRQVAWLAGESSVWGCPDVGWPVSSQSSKLLRVCLTWWVQPPPLATRFLLVQHLISFTHIPRAHIRTTDSNIRLFTSTIFFSRIKSRLFWILQLLKNKSTVFPVLFFQLQSPYLLASFTKEWVFPEIWVTDEVSETLLMPVTSPCDC